MLCSRLQKIQHIQTLLHRHSQIRSLVSTKSTCKWKNSVYGALKFDPMSSHRLRLILRDFTATRLWNACFRTQLVSSVVKRCRRDRVRCVWVCLRQTLLRPSRTLLFSAAAYKADEGNDDDDEDDEDAGGPEPCSQDISDEDLEALVNDFDGVDELSRTTLFCEGCRRRLVIDKQNPSVTYCTCPKTNPPGPSKDGWAPYMEAEDVIIWRKEYKPGGLYAYKVYGRYKDLQARDFAMIQVDGAYRRTWDDAVAALTIVERGANGVPSQAVLHWEVLWPRLFANRDYVYLRRHKEFELKTKCLAHKEAIFSGKDVVPCPPEEEEPPPNMDKPNVHTNAKLKGMELERKEKAMQKDGGKKGDELNKVFVIVSRSCTHPAIPESSNTVRVQEYWSHMVVRTINGPDSVGMEFVLTYYDEPSVGGMPSGVSAWATGRAAPAFLARMHRAAHHYAAWRRKHRDQMPDFEPFDAEERAPQRVEHRLARRAPPQPRRVNELDMESSKTGPELDACYQPRDGAQTDGQDRDAGDPISKNTPKEIEVSKVAVEVISSDEAKVDINTKVPGNVKVEDKVRTSNEVTVIDKCKASDRVTEGDEVKPTETVKSEDIKENVTSKEAESKEATDTDKTKEEQSDESEGDATQKSSWWRYLYPFYYFV